MAGCELGPVAQSPGKPAGDRIELSWLWPGRSVGSDPGCGPSRTSSWSHSALQRGKAAGLPLPRASPRSVPPCLSHQCWNLRTQRLRWGAKPSHLANVDATSPAPAARGPGVVRKLWTESEGEHWTCIRSRNPGWDVEGMRSDQQACGREGAVLVHLQSCLE